MSKGFSTEERAAMKQRTKELKEPNDEGTLLAKIAAMPDGDREMAERIHGIVMKTAPELQGRTYYGMPAWAKDGKVVCFFQDAAKFKSRYATLAFSDKANLDDGSMWPTGFALKKLTKADETKIAALVKQAVN
jgi:uncharacterized protein YdhG (YjbR/CyaY superfamily)